MIHSWKSCCWGQENLALETGLTAGQVYNWFANHRRRQRFLLQRGEQALQMVPEATSAKDRGLEPLPPSGHPCVGSGFVSKPLWSGEWQGPNPVWWELISRVIGLAQDPPWDQNCHYMPSYRLQGHHMTEVDLGVNQTPGP